MKNNSSVGVKFVMKPKTTTAKGSNISNIQGKIQTGDKTYDSVCNSYLKQGCSLEVAKQKAAEVLKNKNESLAKYTSKPSSATGKQTTNPSTTKPSTPKTTKMQVDSRVYDKIQTGDKTYDSVCNSYLKQGCSLEVAKQKAAEVLKNKNEALAKYTKKPSSDAEKQTTNPSTGKSEVHSQAYNQVYESAKRAGASEVEARKAAQEFVDRNKTTAKETATSVSSAVIGSTGAIVGENNTQDSTTVHSQAYNQVYENAMRAGATEEQARKAAQEFVDRNKTTVKETATSVSSAVIGSTGAIVGENNTQDSTTVHSQAYNQVYESAKRAGASEVEARKAAQEFEERNTGTKQETVTQSTGKGTEKNQNTLDSVVDMRHKFSHCYNILNNTSQEVIASIQNSNIFLYNPTAINQIKENIENQITDAKATKDSIAKLMESVDRYSTDYGEYSSFVLFLNDSINNAETVLEQLNNVGSVVYNTERNVIGAVDSCKFDMLNIQSHEGSISVPKEKVAGELAKESKIYSEGKNTMETGSTRSPNKEKVEEKSTKESQVDSNVTITAVTSKTVCSTVADSNYTTLDTINRLNAAYDPKVASSVQYNADLDKLTDAAIERAKQEAGANATPAEIAYCAYKHLADTAKHVRRSDYNYSPQVNSTYNISEATTAGAWRAASVLDADIGMGACQNYAAATVAVFRKLGFDAKVVGGTGSGTEHFWCQVGNFVFDADVDDERNEIGVRFGLTSDEIVAAGRKGYYPETTSGSNGREAVGYNNF